MALTNVSINIRDVMEHFISGSIRSTSTEDLFRQILTSLQKILEVDISGYIIAENETTEPTILHGNELDEKYVKEFTLLLKETFPLFKDKLTSYTPQISIKHPKYLQTWISLPLIHQDSYLGLISIASLKQNAFTQEDVKFLSHVSELVVKIVKAFEERKKQEQIIFRNVLEELSDGFILAKKSGQIVYANPQALDLIKNNCECKDLITTTIPQTNQCTFHNMLSMLISTDQIQTNEKSFLDKNKSIITLKAHPLKGLGASDYAIFISKEKEIDIEAIARQERLAGLGTLAAGLAHEINNPLTILRGYLTLLARTIPSDNTTAIEYLKKVEQQVIRIHNIIHSFLGLAPSKRIQDKEETHTCINELIEELQLSSAVLYSKLAINLKFILEDEKKLYLVKMPKFKLLQVLLNLLENAKDAILSTKFSGEISVFVYQSSREFVTIEISDDGPGIAKNIQPKIFDPFFTTKSKGHGTGLGLTIVKSIIEEYHGKIFFKSKEGVGTAFYVFIPAYIENKEVT